LTKGNSYDHRVSESGGHGYHYSNKYVDFVPWVTHGLSHDDLCSDGSYYYQNTDGSTYYNSGDGYARYTSTEGQVSEQSTGKK